MARKRVSQDVVGLDIEPGFAAAAQVSVNGRLAVERGVYAPLAPEIMSGGEVTDVERLSEALRGLFDSAELGRRVRVGLASARVSVRLLELPPLTDRKDLDAAVRFMAADEMPIPMDQAVLDYHSLGVTETSAGPRTRVLAVAAQREAIDRLLAAVRGAGLRVQGIDLSAFALIRALHRNSSDGSGVTLYASVGGMTNIAIAQDGNCLFTRVTPNGLEAMADELAPRRHLTTDHARGWIAHAGRPAPGAEIEGDAQIVEAARAALASGARSVADDVRASLEFYGAREGAQPVTRVVLAGPAAAYEAFADDFSRELGIEVECATVAGGRPDAFAGADVNAEAFAIAAGLAIEEGLA